MHWSCARLATLTFYTACAVRVTILVLAGNSTLLRILRSYMLLLKSPVVNLCVLVKFSNYAHPQSILLQFTCSGAIQASTLAVALLVALSVNECVPLSSWFPSSPYFLFPFLLHIYFPLLSSLPFSYLPSSLLPFPPSSPTSSLL